MNDPSSAKTDRDSAPSLPASLAAPLTAGLISWVLMALGFLGLKTLMEERPEFVGQPMSSAKAELVQESPRVVIRKVNDDVSVIKPAGPEFSDVRFEMQGRRDYRGLRTIMDMSGNFRARYVVTNAFEEPIFVLFKCPHPANSSGSEGLLAGELKLQASVPGELENSTNAWLWSGMLGPQSSADIEVSYHVASLASVTYRVSDQSGNQVKHLRVTVQQKELSSMRLVSSDSAGSTADETFVWERRDFLPPDFFSARIGENRSLYTSLAHLLQIGPIISLLFLLAASSIIVVRQKLTALQALTLAAGYALYFPLVLYLSANFSFRWALIIAFAVPGILLANYARWLLGSGFALIGAFVFLLLYQVFPTLAAFAGWNRGMVLLCLGVATLAVLINLQNRALRRKAISSALLLALLAGSAHAGAADMQITLPAEIINKLSQAKPEPTVAIVAFSPTQYQVRQEENFFHVEVRIPLQVLRGGEATVPLFDVPVHLLKVEFEPKADFARLVNGTNRLELYLPRSGEGSLSLAYRAPVLNHEGKRRVQIPLALGPAATVQLESPRNDLEFLSGNLWAKRQRDQTTVYEIGVAALSALLVEWRGALGPVTSGKGQPIEAAKDFYGIGITRAQHLTVINSDASCTHFAEVELPAFQTDEFRLKLPARARLISVSVNGNEISSPAVEDQLCRVRLPAREGQQTAHRLSFRIAYPVTRLGFSGTLELTLPEVFQTTGNLEWIVALPNGFETQVISSGLERQKTSPDLSRFGDYGRILQSHARTSVVKDLAPPGLVGLSLRYRQTVPGLTEPLAR